MDSDSGVTNAEESLLLLLSSSAVDIRAWTVVPKEELQIMQHPESLISSKHNTRLQPELGFDSHMDLFTLDWVNVLQTPPTSPVHLVGRGWQRLAEGRTGLFCLKVTPAPLISQKITPGLNSTLLHIIKHLPLFSVSLPPVTTRTYCQEMLGGWQFASAFLNGNSRVVQQTALFERQVNRLAFNESGL